VAQATAELTMIGSSGCQAFHTLEPTQPFSKPAVLAAVAATWDRSYDRSQNDAAGVPRYIRTVTISQLAYVLYKVSILDVWFQSCPAVFCCIAGCSTHLQLLGLHSGSDVYPCYNPMLAMSLLCGCRSS
jgi:hypothetical protein